jgi:alkanesulfonate monooxygenase SsuD/methylene tetrahydromethanopterin reductase-like flavin-dependent oxidoreductase (luciferase family)
VRVGIVILADQPWSVARRRWEAAEAYGFAHAWAYDHIGWRSLVDGPWFDAVPTLAAAALATSRIRLGTMVASPNFRHPVHFAREVTALDDLSGGRLVLGIGAGGMGFDQAVLGQQALTGAQRTRRFEEFVEVLDLVLRAPGAVSYRGRHYEAVEARGLPGCVTKPRTPFVIAANGARAAAVAARYGQGWVTSGGPADDLAHWWRLVADNQHRLDDALAKADREPSHVDRYLVLDASTPVYSLSSVDAFTDAVGRAAELGFTDVVTHWPREEGWFAGDEAVLETVAAEVLPAYRRPPVE